jgi:hypothetical protein
VFKRTGLLRGLASGQLAVLALIDPQSRGRQFDAI